MLLSQNNWVKRVQWKQNANWTSKTKHNNQSKNPDSNKKQMQVEHSNICSFKRQMWVEQQYIKTPYSNAKQTQ